MHLVLIHSDLNELDFIASLDLSTYVLQHLVDPFIEHSPPVFSWKHSVVKQNAEVVTLMDVLAHSCILRCKQRGTNPEEIRLTEFQYITPDSVS